MACCPSEKNYGYDDSRFEKDVDENFYCFICYNVLKEPKMCRNNEHIFCLACITQHLKVNSQTCPECNEHLNVDTLRRAPRVVNNYLSKLKINCDHASRGCREFTCHEDLEAHVVNCGYAPVLCSNAECGLVINKRDKVHHETEVCDYRKVKCHDCGQIQEAVGRVEGSLTELDGKVEASSGEIKKEIGEVKKEVEDIKENLFKVNKDVDEVKVIMTQVLVKLNKLELLNKPPYPTEGELNTPKEDILIAGGSGNRSSKSTEIFSWEKNGWFEVSPMNEDHREASSFIYKDQYFVVGGNGTKTIEILNVNVLPLKWLKFHAELPYRTGNHQTVVYQQSVVYIGGYNYDKRKRSNAISELQLTSSCIMKELYQMPEPRDCLGAEVFEDKVVILGGHHTERDVDSVLEYDPKKGDCKEMPKLPFALMSMATVRWKEEVVLLGGFDENAEARNDVFMYNSKTGKITDLPSMLERRYSCCAVITGNTIVVMGGRNEEYEVLSSVECFTMGSFTWKYLPPMNKARYEAVAEVLPSTRKYV